MTKKWVLEWIVAFAKSFFCFDLPPNRSCWSFWGSEATAESQIIEILRFAQNDKIEMRQLAIFFATATT
jgi:hypothetical protein